MRLLAVPALLIGVVVAGCSKPQDVYVGSYTGKLELSRESKKRLYKDPDYQPYGEMWAKGALTLTLYKDGTFTSKATMRGYSEQVGGHWALEDNKVVITSISGLLDDPETLPSNRVTILTPSNDKKTLSLGQGSYGSLILTKSQV